MYKMFLCVEHKMSAMNDITTIDIIKNTETDDEMIHEMERKSKTQIHLK